MRRRSRSPAALPQLPVRPRPEGLLIRDGGRRQDCRTTWLSRAKVEALALAEYRRGRASTYWLTMSEAAKGVGLGQQRIYQLDLPTWRACNGAQPLQKHRARRVSYRWRGTAGR